MKKPDEITSGDIVKIHGNDYEIIRKIGKGKSGYSFLADNKREKVVVKIMHDEPCSYYNFDESKLKSELNAYTLLIKENIPVPKIMATDKKQNLLVKEYIPGKTAAEAIAEGEFSENLIEQLFDLAARGEKGGINLDYFPFNFVVSGDKLFYIDYEVNLYSEEWSLPNWGIWYYANKEGFARFISEGKAEYINSDLEKGIPVKAPFAEIVSEWLDKYQ